MKTRSKRRIWTLALTIVCLLAFVLTLWETTAFAQRNPQKSDPREPSLRQPEKAPPRGPVGRKVEKVAPGGMITQKPHKAPPRGPVVHRPPKAPPRGPVVHKPRKPYPRGPVMRKPHKLPPRGTITHKLPPKHRIVRHGKFRFYYYGGAFYRRGASGFVVVSPPYGAVVAALPVGFWGVVVGGLTYYVYGDIYYRRVPSGYVVVQPPVTPAAVQEISPVVPSQLSEGEQVSVMAHSLNVRSGPGLDFPVIYQVQRGQLLLVRGYAPEWIYVELPSGELGWVMLIYTMRVILPGSG